MTHKKLLRVPVTDVAWLRCAITDALAGRVILVPVADSAGQGAAETGLSENTAVTDSAIQQHPDAAVLLHTSGSTGTPKTVMLSADALAANAAASHAALDGAGQWLVALPFSTMGGFGQLVRSATTGIDPVFSGTAEPHRFSAAAAEMTHRRRYTSLVPTQLRRLLDAAEQDRNLAETLRSFTAILVGGGATDTLLRQRAYDAGVNIVRTYGATETAGGCVYDGVEIGDTRVRVRGGEVQISGSNLALGYSDAPQLTQQRFITDQSGRWYRTGDAGELLGGMLQVTGRLDRVFISGGTNVSLERIESVLSEVFPAGTFCVVAVPDKEWGERAALVYDSSLTGTAQDPKNLFSSIQELLRTRIGRAATLVATVETPQLLQLSSGKPDLQFASQLAQGRIA